MSDDKLDKIASILTEVQINIAILMTQKTGQDKLCNMCNGKIEECNIKIENQEIRITTLETSSSNNKTWIVNLLTAIGTLGTWLYVFIHK